MVMGAFFLHVYKLCLLKNFGLITWGGSSDTVGIVCLQTNQAFSTVVGKCFCNV